MRVIDLLNKIANGEDVPTFRYLDRTLRYNKEEKCFDDINDICYCRTGFGCNGLNDEVEIIEKDKPFNKKVEEIYNRHIDYIYDKEDKKIEKITNMNCIDAIDSNCYERYSNKAIALDINTLRHQINKVIDYIKEEK